MRTVSKGILLASIFCFIGIPAWSHAIEGSAPAGQRDRQFNPHTLLVKFRAGVTAHEADAAAHAAGALESRAFKRPRRLAVAPVDRWRVVGVRGAADLARVRAALLRNPHVENVEYDYAVQPALMPNDPRLSELWGLHNIGQIAGAMDADIDAPEAWDMQTGSASVVVAVIDTGIDYNHPDLAANMWTNPGETPGNGIDDDGNGYVDDVHGYDFYGRDADPFDDHGHGTHVAGTIAAVGDNGIGVVGVNWRARVMAVKFLGSGGSGYTSDAISSVLYATDMGAKVLNNSWGGGGFSQALEDAIRTAHNAGVLFVAAAGNSNNNNDLTPHYPSSYAVPNVIAVAATDAYDGRAYFSSYGLNSVHLGAPGVGILSSVPAAGAACCSDPSGYKLLNGTSMATPHVAGAAALLLAHFADIGHVQTRDRLLAATDPVSSMSGVTSTGGRLNVFNAFETDTVAPAAVADLASAGTGGRSVWLNWTASGDDAGQGTAARYDLRYSTAPIDDGNFLSAQPVTGLAKPAVAGTAEGFRVRGLEPSTGYYFALKVIDNVGNASPLSNVVQATTQAVSAVFTDDMESGGAKWTVAGSDGAGGSALWHLTSHRYNTPNSALYYGRADTFTFDTGARNYGSVTSPPIDLSASRETALRFMHYLQTENWSPYDAARVQVSADTGATWKDLYVTSIGTGGAMERRDIDLSAYDGTTILLRFSFDTVDAGANFYEGWVIDDVLVTGVTNGEPFPNRPPVAHPGGPYSAYKRAAITFSGASSYDPDGDTLTYQWDFGDGTTATGPSVTHAFDTSGTHTVTLVVHDGKASSAPATTTATVSNRAPKATIYYSRSGVDKYQPIDFDGSYSTDPDGDTLTYQWDFGDGVTATGAKVSHAWQQSGTYDVTLTVGDGEATAQAKVNIIVAVHAPFANAGPDQTVPQRTLVTLDGSGSLDVDGRIARYEWKQYIGEPVQLQAADTAHPTFIAPRVRGSGPATVAFSLVVYDDDGWSSFTDYVYITVTK